MNKVNIINGGPGVGKTTVLKQMISIARRDGYSVLLCAPTGRAAQRMSESTQMPASTIHRALNLTRWKVVLLKTSRIPWIMILLS